ncbi:MAG: class I SAM-dependent methyltransferase [Chloroflexota bacterium]
MGWYGERILPRLLDIGGRHASALPLRARACAGLSGDVLEIGFGSGRNIGSYPAAVARVAAVEPSDLAWELSQDRRAGAPMPIERSGLDAQLLLHEDDSFDACLSTWTLCSIPDVQLALREVRRVLRPGATLWFVEHGLAPDDPVVRWQHRLEPLQHRLFGGCHLTRPIDQLVRDAGFEMVTLDRFYMDASPRFLGATYLGSARA